uniref:Uncharacterized protein n=1 Tax=Anopheles dirus TaxID=7168 RepID=A0A182NGB5_9DIPT
MKKEGKRFVIACHKTKCFRGDSTKGEKEELEQTFGKDNMAEICKELLAKSKLQALEQERQHQLDSMFTEIAATAVDKRVRNPESKRPVDRITQLFVDHSKDEYPHELWQQVESGGLQPVRPMTTGQVNFADRATSIRHEVIHPYQIVFEELILQARNDEIRHVGVHESRPNRLHLDTERSQLFAQGHGKARH